MIKPSEDDRVDTRAELLPEEKAAGSEDPRAQAETILEESEERTADPESTRRESTQTPDEPPTQAELNDGDT
ncbi:MAG TPA: hypothetical protein VIR30_12380 [Nocardioides sp.]|uniref:Uncharacterized protein n=1 Tax=Nocardioides daedukensis TaxID=634462 RepID=A0A7Y9S108_9ACTN|nr:hypothetical protein [Nocardioides daedukensis]NYG57515.1 hypothetical protein [Nocardioides daedukensis]